MLKKISANPGLVSLGAGLLVLLACMATSLVLNALMPIEISVKPGSVISSFLISFLALAFGVYQTLKTMGKIVDTANEIRDLAHNCIVAAPDLSGRGIISESKEVVEYAQKTQAHIDELQAQLNELRLPRLRKSPGRPRAALPPAATDYGLTTADEFYTFLKEAEHALDRKDGSFNLLCRNRKRPIPINTAKYWVKNWSNGKRKKTE